MSNYLSRLNARPLLLSVLLSATPGAMHAQQISFTPFHADGIYRVGEIVGWKVVSPSVLTHTRYRYVIKRNNYEVIKTGLLDLSSSRATITVSGDEPEMILVEVTDVDSPASSMQADAARQVDSLPTQSGVAPVVKLLGAAVDPTKLKPSVARPGDFDSFWQDKLAELAKIPVNPVVTPIPSGDLDVALATVKLDSVDSHVQGYIAKPATTGKYPALIIFQYAGVYKLDPTDTVSHAHEGWLTFDVDSHDIPPSSATGVPEQYYVLGDNDREKSYFLDMYLRDARAVDYIMSRPDWDGKTIVLYGTSMGGQQSLVTAALRSKWISAVIVNEPAGADTNGNLHGHKAGYPYWNSSDPQVMKASLYFDPVNFAPMIKAPTMLSMGFIDTSAPPAGIWIIYNQLAGPKEAITMIGAAHNNLDPEQHIAFTNQSKAAIASLIETGHLRLPLGGANRRMPAEIKGVRRTQPIASRGESAIELRESTVKGH